MNTKNPIVLVGSIALDTIKTPYDSRDNILGGSSTYALLAGSIKGKINLVGVVGNDFPENGWELYKKSGSDLTDLQVKEGSTFRWGGSYHENMEDRDTLFTELGVFETFNPVLSNENQSANYVFLANIHPDLQLNVLSQMKNKPLAIVDTMNLWIEIARDSLDNVLLKTDILLINESEAVMYTNEEDLTSAALELKKKGPGTVVIKRGSKGATVYKEDGEINIGVFPISKVVDPTGAGDTFGGGFISVLASGGNLAEAASWGSALASVCVEGFGAEKLISLNSDELEHRYRTILDSVIT